MSDAVSTPNYHGLIEVADIDGIDTEAVKYVYITIPKSYVILYHKILVLLADYGVEMLEDCKASCTSRNKDIIECYNMFNAAIAARRLEKTSLETALITYLNAKLELIYKNDNNPNTSFVFPIDDNGHIKAVVTNDAIPKIYVNPEDGHLYKTFVEGCYNHNYIIEDNHLIINDNNE